MIKVTFERHNVEYTFIDGSSSLLHKVVAKDSTIKEVKQDPRREDNFFFELFSGTKFQAYLRDEFYHIHQMDAK